MDYIKHKPEVYVQPVAESPPTDGSEEALQEMGSRTAVWNSRWPLTYCLPELQLNPLYPVSLMLQRFAFAV